jgi:Fe-Mn family superoxide dismutase
MKKVIALSICLSFVLTLESCHKKKYTEVVEVPLPSKDTKVIIGIPEDVKAAEGAFSLVKIPYKYEDLAPNFDAMTMELHYSKHYLTHTNNLNKLVKGTELEPLTIEEILKKADGSNADLRNNAGGYYNHSLYFDIISPKPVTKPKDSLAMVIDRDFGSFGNFKSQFIDAALKQFGSGWAWLVVDKSGKLLVTSTANQDNPLMSGQTVSGTPIIALDVWEHAYYLSFQNRRKNYVDAFFKVLNWDKVNEKYEEAIKK